MTAGEGARGLPHTDRVEFRRWRASDLPLASALWQNPDVMRFLGGPYSEEQVTARLGREVSNEKSSGVQYWPIFVAPEGEYAGCCGLRPHDVPNRFYELGFHLLPRFQGRGYAFEAARAAMSFAFAELRAEALFAGHHPENIASRTLLTRLGFVQIGTHFYEPTGLQHPWYQKRREGGDP